ncbi:MAG: hypothetical protein ACI8RA_002591 [Chlamydiales bacterium]
MEALEDVETGIIINNDPELFCNRELLQRSFLEKIQNDMVLPLDSTLMTKSRSLIADENIEFSDKCAQIIKLLEVSLYVLPLFKAVARDHAPAISCLLAMGSSVNCRNSYGETPIFSAYSRSTVQRLLNHKADINACDKAGNTLLHKSFETNALRTLR